MMITRDQAIELLKKFPQTEADMNHYLESEAIMRGLAEKFGDVLDGHDSGEPKIKLCPALTDYKWVTLEEAKNYDLIEGIYEELEILDKNLRRSAYTLKGTSPKNLNEGARIGKNMEWKKREEEGKMDEWGKILDDGADMEWKKREEELFWGN